MSNYLNQYLAYIANWAAESDDHIQNLIDEFNLLMEVGDYDSDSAVDSEFNMLVSIATNVRDLTVAGDAEQVIADGAAIAALWTFGASMAVFAVAEASAIALKAVASSQARELNEKLQSADSDISAKINPQVHDYIGKFKSNNTAFKEMESVVGGRLARKFLFTFMAGVYHKRGSLDVEWFRKYANVAKKLNDDLLNQVGDALDQMTLQDGPPTDAQIEDVMNKLQAFKSNNSELERSLEVARFPVMSFVVVDLRVAAEKVVKIATRCGIVGEGFEFSEGIANSIEAVEMFSRVMGVAFAILDIVFNIYNIVQVVEQTNAWVTKLNDEIRPRYKEFYNGIRRASKAFNKAFKDE